MPEAPITDAGVRPAGPALRPLLLGYALLGFGAGVPLFLNSGDTHQFAWTIKPPLTAAFLGAAYWASLVLNLVASRERVWARARIAVVPGLLFTTLMLVATLIHLDRFHLHSSDALARAVAWVWLVAYIAIPPATLAVLVAQLRAPGGDPPRAAPLRSWLRSALVAQGVVMVALGASLFAAPGTSASLWPWTLTPLTSRATGSWLCGIGLTAVLAALENDLRRVRAVLAGYAVLGGLEAIAVARYPHTLDWHAPMTCFYLVFLATVLAVALAGLFAARSVAKTSP
jgi:hypothetical protein